MRPTNGTHALLNQDVPPFDNPQLRRAIALSPDRRGLINILTDGLGTLGAAMLVPPEGLWGLPLDEPEKLSGYGADVEKNRVEARTIMEKLGCGPDNPLAVKVMTRNATVFRDTAVALTDQLKQTYIASEIDSVETAQWYPKLARKDFARACNLTGRGVDDPDAIFVESCGCGSAAVTPGLQPRHRYPSDPVIAEPGEAKRKALVPDIERRLEEDGADEAGGAALGAFEASLWGQKYPATGPELAFSRSLSSASPLVG